MYNFYHNKDLSNLKSNNINPYNLYDMLSNIWCKYSCSPRLRDKWNKDNRALGQCSITAFIVQDIFGGKVYGFKLKDGNYHCYNVIDDYVLDLTSEGFGNSYEYLIENEQSRDAHFKNKEKYERYSFLKRSLNDYKNGIFRIKTEKFEMRYFKFGSGSKNMVIIPGLSILSIMESKDAIINQYKKFQDEYSVYVFDRKEDIQEGYQLEDMACDLIDSIDILGLYDLYVFSTSQGGMIAQLIAINRPNLIKKLVLGSSTAYVTLESKQLFLKWIYYAMHKTHEELILEFTRDVYTTEFFDKYKMTFIDMSKYITDADINRYIILTKSMLEFDIRDKIYLIKSDVLSITSKDDMVFDYRLLYEIKDKINLTIYEYEHGGHAVYDEDEKYVDKIFDFFSI